MTRSGGTHQLATSADPEDLTLAEKLFEQTCASKGIVCCRIPVAKGEGHRHPDYKVATPNCGAVVEVKQLDPNDEDRRQEQELRAGRSVAWTKTPGARLRKAIRDASGQLSRISRRGIPTVVAVFDSRFSISDTDPYNVKTALFGLDAIVLAVPNDPNERPYIAGWKRAGKAVLTPEHNTSVSGVVIIRVLPSSEGRNPFFLLYHNHFARVPLIADHLRDYVDHQYALGMAENGVTDWAEL